MWSESRAHLTGPDVVAPAVAVQELVQVESLAQMGVQLLLFTLGLEFSLSKLKAVRSVALAGGMIQITAFMILAGLLATFIGASVHEGVFIGALVRGRQFISCCNTPDQVGRS